MKFAGLAGVDARDDLRAGGQHAGRVLAAVDSFGERIASRLEAEVADARRQCEDRGVDAGLLRSAVTEVEVLLKKLAKDNDVVVAAVRDPDRFGDVIRGRVQRRRRNVEAAAEPFFDALVRVVTGEFVLLAPGSKSFQIGALRQLLGGVEGLSKIVADIEIGQKYIIENISQIKETLPGPVPRRPSRIRLGSRPMEVSGFVGRLEQKGLFGAVFAGALGIRLMAGQQTLNLYVEVRILCPQLK